MTTSPARYRPCPHCSALNMTHRETCYRCAKPLTGALGYKPAARQSFRPASADTRRRKRHTIHLEGVVVQSLGSGEQMVTVYDLSADGLQMRSAVTWEVGAHVHLRLPLEGTVWTLAGTVRYVCPMLDENGRTDACGIQFDDIPAELEQIITRLIQ